MSSSFDKIDKVLLPLPSCFRNSDKSLFDLEDKISFNLFLLSKGNLSLSSISSRIEISPMVRT